MNMKIAFVFLSVLTVIIILILTLVQLKTQSYRNETGLINKITYSNLNNYDLAELKNFNYTINPNNCDENVITWIVTSYSGEPSPRSALRRAYPNEELQIFGIKRIFLLGLLDEETKAIRRITQKALLDEASIYNDILQGNFIEAYRNLTYKHLMGLKWVFDNCKNTHHVIKMDDDIIVNLYELTTLLKNHPIEPNVIAGYVMKNMIPIREPANKWFTNEHEFPFEVYPDYVSGWLYITHLKTVERLIEQTKLHNKYFWIDDIFFTGILTNDLNIKLRSMNELFATDYRYLNCCIKGKKDNLKCEYVIGPNGGDNELQVRFKEFAQYCSKACSMRSDNNSVTNTCIAVYEKEKLKNGQAQVQQIKVK